MNAMICCRIEDLTYTYPGASGPVLNDFSLSISEGELVILCGPSGCGKTTLLKQLLPGRANAGKASGRVFLFDEPLEALPAGFRVGYVRQDPAAQLRFTAVGQELRRNLSENPNADIRCAEMVSFFGMQSWLHAEVSSLSGGQKQLLNLAAELAASPQLMVLDEPTSQLDPVAASNFLSAVGRINRELGVTIIMTEHRLEELLPMASVLAIMENGRLVISGPPSVVGTALQREGHRMFFAMPAPMRVYSALSRSREDCPVSVREGRVWLEAYGKECKHGPVPEQKLRQSRGTAAGLQNIWFRYEKNGKDILKGTCLEIPYGCVTAVVGGNGTGKSTLASVLAGKAKPYRGKVKVNTEEVVYLPQDPLAVLTGNTVRESFPPQVEESRVERMAERCGITHLLSRSPESLSGGERQLAAVCRMLLQKGKIYILDEITKGLDNNCRGTVAEILAELADAGAAVFLISHDLDFCAALADTCALLFDGNVVSADDPQSFFSSNTFYTTAASRMSRSTISRAVTSENIISAFKSPAG